MKKGFYTIMSAQFFSSLADNALLVAAIELLQEHPGPGLAGAGAGADVRAVLRAAGAVRRRLRRRGAQGPGHVRLATPIKVVGCLMMLFGGHPLLAYAIVGLGAAAYSPAKYGILTELLPPSQLVKANGWIEGLTIASIILGVLLGGQLVGPRIAPMLLGSTCRCSTPASTRRPRRRSRRSCCCTSWRRSSTSTSRAPTRRCSRCATARRPGARLLASATRACGPTSSGRSRWPPTTLFWGVVGNLRVIVFAWAAAALGYGTTQASTLAGVVAIGTTSVP